MPLLTDKQRKAVEKYHENKRNEARNEIMRQALNVVNRQYFGMPSDNRKDLPRQVASYQGPRNEYIKWMEELQDQAEEAVEEIERLRIELRRHDAAQDEWPPTDEWLGRAANLENELSEWTQWHWHLENEMTEMRKFATKREEARRELRNARRIDL